jgi:hypothetical protein
VQGKDSVMNAVARSSIGLILIVLAGCAGGGRVAVPYSQWTECPAQARFSEHRWATMESVNEQMIDYAWTHHCTFWFVGASPADVVRAHNHPHED